MYGKPTHPKYPAQCSAVTSVYRKIVGATALDGGLGGWCWQAVFDAVTVTITGQEQKPIPRQQRYMYLHRRAQHSQAHRQPDTLAAADTYAQVQTYAQAHAQEQAQAQAQARARAQAQARARAHTCVTQLCKDVVLPFNWPFLFHCSVIPKQ